MLAKVISCSVVGLEGTAVEVEVDIYANSLPSITLVGLPDAAVNDSVELLRAAPGNARSSAPRPSL